MADQTQLKALLDEYGESHQDPVNRALHKVCVPAIMLSLLGLLAQIPGPMNWAYVIVALALIYYAQFKSLMVYVAFGVQAIPMLALIHYSRGVLGWPHWLGIFIIAWIGQFIGHHKEGKKPSFFRDVFFLLIGPLWIVRPLIKN